MTPSSTLMSTLMSLYLSFGKKNIPSSRRISSSNGLGSDSYDLSIFQSTVVDIASDVENSISQLGVYGHSPHTGVGMPEFGHCEFSFFPEFFTQQMFCDIISISTRCGNFHFCLHYDIFLIHV